MEDGGWSQPVGRPRQQPYSVETAKLKNKLVSYNMLKINILVNAMMIVKCFNGLSILLKHIGAYYNIFGSID